MTTKQRTMGLAAAMMCVLDLAGGAAAQDVKPNAVQIRAQRDVVDGAARLTKLAYVSSNSHTKVEYVKGNAYRDESFDLTYKFTYRDSDNDTQTYTLRFEYSKTGAVTGVVTIQHSSFWKPFNAIEIAGAVVDGVAKELGK